MSSHSRHHFSPTHYTPTTTQKCVVARIAYGKPPDCNHDGGCDPLYKHEWASIITQIRNHPCVFDYTMVRSTHLDAGTACRHTGTQPDRGSSLAVSSLMVRLTSTR